MPDGLEFRITRTRDDYFRAYRVFCWRSRLLRAAWLLLSVFPVYLLLMLISGLVNGEITEWSQVQGTVSYVTSVIFIFVFVYFLAPLLSARSVPRQGTDWNVLIDGEGILEDNAAERTRAPWGMFTSALETSNEIVLIRGQVGFRYYPKRTLDSRILRQFRDAIRTNIPKSRLKKSASENGEFPVGGESTSLKSTIADSSWAQPANEAGASESLRFELTLTAEDYKRAYRLYMRKSKGFAVLCLFIVSTYIYLIFDNIIDAISGEPIADFIISIFPATILYFLLICYIYFWKPVRIARSAPDVGATYQITVSSAGIAISSNLGNAARYGWEKFTAATETASDFLLFRAGSQFNAYPKRMLTDPRYIGKFRELIRENVPKAKLRDQSS